MKWIPQILDLIFGLAWLIAFAAVLAPIVLLIFALSGGPTPRRKDCPRCPDGDLQLKAIWTLRVAYRGIEDSISRWEYECDRCGARVMNHPPPGRPGGYPVKDPKMPLPSQDDAAEPVILEWRSGWSKDG